MAGVDLELTDHARRRLRQRGITRADVEAVLSSSQSTTRRSREDPDTALVTGWSGRRRITVVIVRGSQPRRIVTAWLAP